MRKNEVVNEANEGYEVAAMTERASSASSRRPTPLSDALSLSNLFSVLLWRTALQKSKDSPHR